MGIVYLKNGGEIDVTEEQSLFIAKWIMLYPNDLPMRVAGVSFSADDIDIKKERMMKLPQQVGFGLEVEVVDKKTEKRME